MTLVISSKESGTRLPNKMIGCETAAYRVTDVGKEMVSPFLASAAVARGVATMLQGP